MSRFADITLKLRSNKSFVHGKRESWIYFLFKLPHKIVTFSDKKGQQTMLPQSFMSEKGFAVSQKPQSWWKIIFLLIKYFFPETQRKTTEYKKPLLAYKKEMLIKDVTLWSAPRERLRTKWKCLRKAKKWIASITVSEIDSISTSMRYGKLWNFNELEESWNCFIIEALRGGVLKGGLGLM